MPVTQHPRIWINFLFPPLRRHEQAVIDAWIVEVGADTREIVRSQLRLINLARRSAKGKVVELYYIKSGTALGDFDRRLPLGPEEMILGEVEMVVARARMVCQLIAVNGRLFSLEFDKVPRLALWRPRIGVVAVNASTRPLKPSLEELQDLLPLDYAEIAETAASLASIPRSVSVLNLDQIYASTFEAGRFWLFAEVPDVGMFGVRADGRDKQVYFLFYDGSRVLALGNSFRRALERVRGEFAKE